MEEIAATSVFAPCYSHQAVVKDDKIYVIGGIVGWINSDEVWSSANGCEWNKETTEDVSFSARGGHQVALLNSELFVIGGFDKVVPNPTWHYRGIYK